LGAGSIARRTSPISEARIGDWSTQDVARRWRIGASRRIKWTLTADQAVLMTLASTAICVPATPAKAAAAGTTQNPLLGLAAQASSAPSPALRRPRVACEHRNITQSPAARPSGPKSSPIDVSRQTATSDSVAEVARIWARRTTGHTRCTAGPPWAVAQPRIPPAMKQTRLSTASIVPCWGFAARRWPPRVGGTVRLYAHSANS
jgi:hypothetical protein